jgi:hypothetical protein
MFGRLLRLVIVGWIGSMVAAAIAAVTVKRQVTPTTDESDDEIAAVAIFGPLAFHSTSQAFRGGVLECWYGGGVLDLRDAQLAPEGATLKVRAIFGGGQIIVPVGWRVVSHVRGMGGIQDVRPTQGYSAIDPELVIEGLLIAGGFAVTSELAEGQVEWLQGMKEKQDAAAASLAEATEQARERVAEATEQAREKVAEVTDQARDKVAEVTGSAEDAAATVATAEGTPDESKPSDETGGESETSEAYAPTT